MSTQHVVSSEPCVGAVIQRAACQLTIEFLQTDLETLLDSRRPEL